MHHGRWVVHGSSHDGMVLSGVCSLCLPAFINMKHPMVGWANSMFANACINLLYWLFLRLFMCLFVQLDSRWRHVLICWDVHGLHNGDMSCSRACFLW